MNATTIREAEFVTRSIGRWSSAAAALIFGVAFITDNELSWHIVSNQAVHIGLIVVIFAGYALAWIKRFELLGSVIVLIGMAAVGAYCMRINGCIPDLFFLALGAPALIHFVAIVLHRFHGPT